MHDRLQLVTDLHKKSPKDSYLAFAAAVENQLAGHPQKAIEIIEKLIVNDPEYVDAYYKLGKLYENDKKLKKAVQAYHAGKRVASKKNDQKSLGEITEALMFLDDEEGNW